MHNEVMIISRYLQSKNFIDRWLIKSEQYDQEKLEDCFDCFFTLFVVFNRLYNDVKELISVRGETVKMINDEHFKSEFNKNNNIGDQKASTVCVAYFLKNNAEEVIKDNQANIKSFLELLPQFNIHLKNGEPQKDKDDILIQSLTAKENEVVLLAILKTLYQIRCNTFHGEKQMIPRQMKLLTTSNNTLRNIINSLMQGLLPS